MKKLSKTVAPTGGDQYINADEGLATSLNPIGADDVTNINVSTLRKSGMQRSASFKKAEEGVGITAIKTFDERQLADWVKSLGGWGQEVAPIFIAHWIDGKIFPFLDQHDFLEMGISRAPPRLVQLSPCMIST